MKNNESGQSLIHVRFGINLGPVRVVKDINGRPNIIGDGINVAQRIMSFAQPNQILVSRSYYEITSRLTQEISQMFDYSGVKHDKHVRDHEVYSVRLNKDNNKIENQSEVIADSLPLTNQLSIFNKINWNYAAPAVFVMVTLFAISKLAFAPSEPANVSNIASNPATATVAARIKPADEVIANNVPATKILEQKKVLPQAKVAKPLSKKKVKQKVKRTPEALPERSDIAQNSNNANAQTSKSADSKISQQKANHEVARVIAKSASLHQCSQAQIAMSQCN